MSEDYFINLRKTLFDYAYNALINWSESSCSEDTYYLVIAPDYVSYLMLQAYCKEIIESDALKFDCNSKPKLVLLYVSNFGSLCQNSKYGEDSTSFLTGRKIANYETLEPLPKDILLEINMRLVTA